jgi:hypothetical protein
LFCIFRFFFGALLLKTCMQGDVGGAKYKSIPQTAQSLVAEFGAGPGLFKGFGWRVSLIATTFFLVNTFKQNLEPVMFPEKPLPGEATK